MSSKNKMNGCSFCNTKNINVCIYKESPENFINEDLLGLDESEISEIPKEKSNDDKEANEEKASNYSFLSDVNENERQFMKDFIFHKHQKDLIVKIDLINPEPEIKGIERENLLKENLNLLSIVITEKINGIIREEESTKETDIKIKAIEKEKEFLKRKRYELFNN